MARNIKTFNKWFYEVFESLCANCGPHWADVSDPINEVKIVPLPPNYKSVHRPMDNGITSLKRNY